MVEGVFIPGKGADPINLGSLAPMRGGTNIYQHATGYDKEQESNTVLRGKGFIRKAGIAKKKKQKNPQGRLPALPMKALWKMSHLTGELKEGRESDRGGVC